MGAINENALSKLSGVLETAPIANPTSFTRLASVTGLINKIDTDANRIKIEADDTGVIYEAMTPDVSVECALYEIFDRDLLNSLIGGTSSDIAGSIVSGASQVVASGAWAYNKFIKITNQNGDGSAITVNSVTAGTNGLLVEDTDYYVGRNDDGEYGIFIIDSTTVTTLSQSMTINYDYTPTATERLVISAAVTELPQLVVRITATATDGSGKYNGILCTPCTYSGAIDLGFVDVQRAGDMPTAAVKFALQKGGTCTIDKQIL